MAKGSSSSQPVPFSVTEDMGVMWKIFVFSQFWRNIVLGQKCLWNQSKRYSLGLLKGKYLYIYKVNGKIMPPKQYVEQCLLLIYTLCNNLKWFCSSCIVIIVLNSFRFVNGKWGSSQYFHVFNILSSLHGRPLITSSA